MVLTGVRLIPSAFDLILRVTVLTEISVDNFLGPLSLVSEPTAFIRHTINTWNLTDKAAHFVFNFQDIQYFLNEHGI